MAMETMLSHLTRNWGWIVLRGIVAIAFGALAFAMPGITLSALVIVWGAYALADGAFALFAGIRLKMWPLILVGLLGIAAGIITFMRPGITAVALLALIGGWALAAGIFQIVAAIRFRQWISNEWLMILSGLLSIAFAVLVLLRPGAGALSVVWTIGWFAVLYGVMNVVVGFRIKGLANQLTPKPA